MVPTDMMAEYVRQLLDLDEASLNATLESLSQYSGTRADADGGNDKVKEIKEFKPGSTTHSYTEPVQENQGSPFLADEPLKVRPLSPLEIAANEKFMTHEDWNCSPMAAKPDTDPNPISAAAPGLPTDKTALRKAIAGLTMSLPPASAAAAHELLSSAVAELDMPQSGDVNRQQSTLLQRLQGLLEKQQEESAQRLLTLMQAPHMNPMMPPWHSPEVMAPGLVNPTCFSEGWSAMDDPMQVRMPSVPGLTGNFSALGSPFAASKPAGQQNQTLWYDGTKPLPTTPVVHHSITQFAGNNSGRGAVSGHRSQRNPSTRDAQHPSARPAGPKSKSVAQQDSNEATIRSHLRWLQNVDPSRVLLVRKINRLGFESPAVLESYFAWYGEVERVLVSHSRVKTMQNCSGHVSSRLRPSGVGFVVMKDAEMVPKILAAGFEQVVAGVTINVHKFERRSSEDGSGSPSRQDSDGQKDSDTH